MWSRGHSDAGRSGRRAKPVRVDAAAIERLLAPSDCATSDELVRLLRRIDLCLRRRPEVVVLDLSHLRSMNTLLLSVVIYLARECAKAGVRLRLDGVSPLFRDWAATHGLLRHLHDAGLVRHEESLDETA